MQPKKIITLAVTLFLGVAIGFYIGYGVGYERNNDGDTMDDADKYVFESDVIKVTSPLSNSVISSPVTIKGEAVGNWFFEANLPIRITDNQGNQLGQGFAMTADEWMTTDFVSFEGTVSFDVRGNTEGYILLQKDNPSGLSEHNDERKMPIRFKQPQGTRDDQFIKAGEEWMRYENESLDLSFAYRQYPVGYIWQKPQPGVNE